MAKGKEYYHPFLGSKGLGASKRLCGDVITVIFFVNDGVSRWTEKAKQKYLDAHFKALNELKRQAESVSVEFSYRYAHCELVVSADCGIKNVRDWKDELIATLHCPSVEDYQKFYKGKHPADEVPIIFVFNKKGRGFAYNASAEYPLLDEYSVIFQHTDGSYSPRTVMHELVHQFGGADLYYPEEIKAAADKYLPNSLMNIGNENQNRVDGLTAYLIGWTDTLDKNARAFIKEIDGVSLEDIQEARGKSIKND